MGTHCAMVIKTENRLYRYERTLDGGLLYDRFVEWADHPETPIDPDQIGNGEFERDDDGEGEQEFGVVLDYTNRTYWVSFSLTKDLLEACAKLATAGWTLKDWNEESVEFQYLQDPQYLKTL